ncbi:MAG: acetylxylan esterase [Gemmataceae bacterium]
MTPKYTFGADPLTLLNGKKVRSAEVWQSQRRAELLELYQARMYGRLPPAPTKLTGTVLHSNPTAFGEWGGLEEIEIRYTAFGQDNPMPIRLLLALPTKRATEGVPIFVGPNFHGNHAFTPDPKIRLPDCWMYPNYPGVVNHRATDAGRGKSMETWPLEMIVKHGYGVATFYNGDIQPDRPKVVEGFRKVAPGTGLPDDTATIMAWAWGLQRCVDYLTTRPEVNAKKIAAVGHSRLGKTALVAGAFDERIAMVIPNQAGCGGTGPNVHKDPKAESTARITTAFPHWFCAAFNRDAKEPEKLPFDQHCLLALCAPRPVLYTNAENDLWANPAGQFAMMRAATPVYELLGVRGLEAGAMPPLDKLSNGRLGYFIRPGNHAMSPADWAIYLEYADKWLRP